MAEEKQFKPTYFGIFPKCPFYKPIPVLIILVMVSLGAIGIYYLDYWATMGYMIFSFLFYFLVMPFTTCKFCYFKVIETTTDEETGKTTEGLLTVEQWSKSHLHLHVGQKGWAFVMALIWFLPIILTGIALFFNFSLIPLFALIGFFLVLVGNYFYMLRIKCPTCPIQEECHSSF
ncbi:MAG: hypothetical protein RTV31_09105 [Candidatus Thorarchaeota archaeon]